ncbi:MAG: VapC toxin family PIN domain ribonuclease [Deltaproteobacteria bacterium]|nr:MAG: VapC toxin family PIN domain ribonuclease [Deltaproteobacteria bacterium]RLB30034.1 MAG: VapC toxin family PIN domain ribonuclease [Deltaproteobacteria bacterium]
MPYLLDTNICIYFLNRSSRNIVEKFRKVRPSQLKISSITVAELYYGAKKSQAASKNMEIVRRFVFPFEIIPFDEFACNSYGIIRYQLEKRGQPIGPMDLLIGAIAHAHKFTLVTNNEKEFRRIKGLRVENWL